MSRDKCRLEVRLSVEDDQLLDGLAFSQGRSKADVIRSLIRREASGKDTLQDLARRVALLEKLVG